MTVIFVSKSMNFTNFYGKWLKKFYYRNFTINLVKSLFIIIKYYLCFYDEYLEV